MGAGASASSSPPLKDDVWAGVPADEQWLRHTGDGSSLFTVRPSHSADTASGSGSTVRSSEALLRATEAILTTAGGGGSGRAVSLALEQLDVGGFEGLTELACPSSFLWLWNVVDVDLSGNQLSSVSLGETMTMLRALNLSGSPVTELNTAPLGFLQDLDLSFTSIRLSSMHFYNMPLLRRLSLEGCELSTLSTAEAEAAAPRSPPGEESKEAPGGAEEATNSSSSSSGGSADSSATVLTTATVTATATAATSATAKASATTATAETPMLPLLRELSLADNDELGVEALQALHILCDVTTLTRLDLRETRAIDDEPEACRSFLLSFGHQSLCREMERGMFSWVPLNEEVPRLDSLGSLAANMGEMRTRAGSWCRHESSFSLPPRGVRSVLEYSLSSSIRSEWIRITLFLTGHRPLFFVLFISLHLPFNFSSLHLLFL